MHKAVPNVEELFFAALELESAEARSAFLNRVCDDTAVRSRVERLLALDPEAKEYLEVPASIPTVTAGPDARSSAEEPGTIIGPYKLMEQIGEGGMGVVYVAEQSQPVRRKVALKIIKPGMDSKQVVARFEAERQALAMMDHPNIAKVLDGGATESARPYFVMELVRGLAITEYCDKEHLSIRERLELFVLVCRAVQHAHQKGIIHRDLKPSNVLVTVIDGTAVPKVIDFGVAKATGRSLTDRTLYTGFTQLVGTPLYMSPEQAEFSGVDVDTRSDIYSLGVLLYELLTGTTPFDFEVLRQVALDELRRIIREEEPPTPSMRLNSLGATRMTVSVNRKADARQLDRTVSGELDWIVMKALDKERRRRYETANDFAVDVMRYLTDRPVEAGPPSAWYRVRKFVRRNRATLMIAAVLSVSVIIGAILVLWQALLVREARQIARHHEETIRQRDQEVRHAQYIADIRRASTLVALSGTRYAQGLLELYRPAAGADDLRGFEWYYLTKLLNAQRTSWVGHEGQEVYHVEYAPDGRAFATAGGDGTARVWDAQTRRQRLVLRGHQGDVNWVGFDSEGRRLVTAGEDGKVRIWDAVKGQELAVLDPSSGEVVAALFTPDGRDVIGATRDCLLVRWDVATGQRRAEVRHLDGKWVVESLAISPKGTTLALAARPGDIQAAGTLVLHDLSSGGLAVTTTLRSGGNAYCVTIANDGRTLATTGHENAHAVIYDSVTGLVRSILEGASSSSYGLSFAPDGQTLAVCEDNSALRIWDLATRTCRAALLGHTDRIWCVAFAPDGRTLATTSRDGTIRLWDTTGRDRSVFRGLRREPALKIAASVAFSDSGSRVLAVNRAGDVLECDLATGAARVMRTPEPLLKESYAFLAPDGATLVVINPGNGLATTTLHKRGAGREPVLLLSRAKSSPDAVSWSPDGKRLAIRVAPDSLALWDSAGRLLGRLPVAWNPYSSLPAFMPTSDAVIAFSGDARREIPSEILTWDPTKSQLDRRRIDENQQRSIGGRIVLSPDGRILADHGNLWDFPSLHHRSILIGHKDSITDLAFAPDGRTVATASLDHTVRLWNVATGQELLTLEGHAGQVRAVAFSPDGRSLASCGDGPDSGIEVIVWRAEARDRGDPALPRPRSP